ncbi:hypothetical protein GMA5_28 [Gordonia phage GMA5]|uniref:Uncharacterized protein n=1 Tax=Gordonia phage GMA5 TaxID=1647472 RepID=A0A0K0MWN5_9CAUD|nr:hypothetical protein BH786_gp28 [Gordonia phage GMA5]AKI28642.1 hypothetical protein GMA5_28 [Gordonia phage GMA5]
MRGAVCPGCARVSLRHLDLAFVRVRSNQGASRCACARAFEWAID